MKIRRNLCWTLTAIVLLPGVHAADKYEIPAHATGLLVGNYDPGETAAANREEATLGLKPIPGLSQAKPFYLYVPKEYTKERPPPLVIVLHERGQLQQFSTRTVFDKGHLENYAKRALDAWKDRAEKEGFLLMLPLGDPDTLWMGMSWYTGSRPKLFETMIQAVGKTHSHDKSRVYVAASGEGAHAAIATGLRRGDLITAVAACNPPLFDGKSRRDNTIFPETIDEMLIEAGKRKTPLLILAGDRDKELRIAKHQNLSLKTDRYEDSSSIPAEHLKKMTAPLTKAGFAVEFKTIPTRHFAPLPAGEVEAVWKWLKQSSIQQPAVDPKR